MAQKESPSTRETIRHKSTTYNELYTNSVDLKVSVYDFELVFGKVIAASDTRLEIEQKVSITMSPQHAKEFLRILQENVRNYELRFGPIVSTVNQFTESPPVKTGVKH